MFKKYFSEKDPNAYLYRESYIWVIWVTMACIPAILGYLNLNGLEEVLLALSVLAVVADNLLPPAGPQEKIVRMFREDRSTAHLYGVWVLEIGIWFLWATFWFFLAAELTN